MNDPCIPDEWASHFTDPSSFVCPSDTSCSVVSRDPTSGLQYGSCISEEKQIRAGESCIDVVLSGDVSKGDLYNLHSYERTLTQQFRYSISSNNAFSETHHIIVVPHELVFPWVGHIVDVRNPSVNSVTL